MAHLGKTMVELGIVPAELLQETARWGGPVPDAQAPAEVVPLEEAAQRIQEVRNEQEYTEVRVTDFHIRDRYLATEQDATLHVHLLAGTKDANWCELPLRVGIGLMQEVIIPWKGTEELHSLLEQQDTFLERAGKQYYIEQIDAVHIGETPAFLLCKVVLVDLDG